MRSKIFLWILALLCGLALVGPVEAITIGGVDYALYARCKIGLEQSGTVIDGNVRVAQICGGQQGFLQLGAGITINGYASANTMFFGTNATVTGPPPACVFNISLGGLFSVVCPGSASGVPPFVADTLWPPLLVPAVVSGTTDVVCTGTLPPGAYGDITVPDGVKCKLTGTVSARTFLLGNGGTLAGNGGATQALNLTGGFTAEEMTIIKNVNITSVVGVVNPANPGPTPTCTGATGLGSTAAAIITGNGATVTGSIFYAPCARMHLHQGGTFSAGFGGIAVLITAQPVDIQNPSVCACIGNIEKGAGTIELTNGCHLSASGNQFFVSQTCATVCPGPACTAAFLANPPAPTDTTATLNTPVVPVAGNYHVIVVNTGGQFCTSATVPLP